ncbi:WD40-repeat-containing domain protein [Chytridium lagenaria]|nr:WD40-repeat-containing domain protein [Chytridium lagenaria]
MILPALKRDFLGLLPVELGYQVLEYLDLRSLGRCARVCEGWRRVVEGEGAEVGVWKRRLVREGWFRVEEVRREERVVGLEGVGRDVGKGGEDVGNGESAFFGGGVGEEEEEDEEGGTETCYKRLFRRHYATRQNWVHGRCKTITFPGHGMNVVTCLQFDDEKIVSGSDDATIHVYDVNNGKLLKKLEGHEGGVWALQYWNNTLVSGSTDRTVRVWDLTTGRCSHIFDGHTSTVRCLMIVKALDTPDPTIDPPCPLIVTGSRDATLRVWRLPDTVTTDVEPGNGAAYFMHTLTGHTNSVRAIAGYGRVLVSGSYDCTVRVWDLVTGAAVHCFRGHREKVYSVGYSHELFRAVSGSMDATVRVWCTRTGAMLFNLEGHTSLVGLLEVSTRYVVSAAADATLRVWDARTGGCLATLAGHGAAITCFQHDEGLNRIVWELKGEEEGRSCRCGGGGEGGEEEEEEEEEELEESEEVGGGEGVVMPLLVAVPLPPVVQLQSFRGHGGGTTTTHLRQYYQQLGEGVGVGRVL